MKREEEERQQREEEERLRREEEERLKHEVQKTQIHKSEHVREPRNIQHHRGPKGPYGFLWAQDGPTGAQHGPARMGPGGDVYSLAP